MRQGPGVERLQGFVNRAGKEGFVILNPEQWDKWLAGEKEKNTCENRGRDTLIN